MSDILDRLEDASNFAGNVFGGIFQDAKKELTAANERIRELEAELITARRTINEYAGYFAAEREVLLAERAVSDKLEKALKVAKAFCDGLTAEECPDTVALPISAALAEVKDLRSTNPAIQLDKTRQEAEANGHISEYY